MIKMFSDTVESIYLKYLYKITDLKLYPDQVLVQEKQLTFESLNKETAIHKHKECKLQRSIIHIHAWTQILLIS